MKLFLSWSGQQSRAAAEAMQEWLPFVMNAVQPWMSAADIDAGARWNVAIQSELEETRFGVLFVTRENITAPWLLFEAGALAKTIEDTFVCPYLLDLKPPELPSGPLSQFQAKVADKPGTWQLIQTINRALKEGAIPEDRLEKAFQKWWPELERTISTLPTEPQTEAMRPPEEMIEEILTLVRRIDRNASAKWWFVSEDRETNLDECDLAEPELGELTLTPREFEVCRLVTRGLLNKQIAGRLNLSPTTVRIYRARAMKKLGAKSVSELITLADKAGIFKQEDE